MPRWIDIPTATQCFQVKVILYIPWHPEQKRRISFLKSTLPIRDASFLSMTERKKLNLTTLAATPGVGVKPGGIAPKGDNCPFRIGRWDKKMKN